MHKILLIDDHALFRSGLRMVLSTGDLHAEIFEVDSLEQAMKLAVDELSLLLLDIELRGLNGLDGIALLKRKWPTVQIIVLSADSTVGTVRKAKAYGAAEFVSKAESAEQILAVIQRVLHGPLNHSTDVPDPDYKKHLEGEILLTPRQYEVLDFLCQGLTNKAIGRRLNLSENTVRIHVQAILAALQVENRSEDAFAAHRRGLVR